MKLYGKIFVQVPKHPDYYWCVLTQTLFSIKKKGLRELRVQLPNHFNERMAGYSMWEKGIKHYITVNELKTLNRGECVVLVFPDNHFEEGLFEV